MNIIPLAPRLVSSSRLAVLCGINSNDGLYNPLATATADSNNGASRISGGAIAGIVIGCVAAASMLVLFLFRKKITVCFGREKQPPPETVWRPPSVPTQPPSEVHSQSKSAFQLSEMSGQSARYEMGTAQTHRPSWAHELS